MAVVGTLTKTLDVNSLLAAGAVAVKGALTKTLAATSLIGNNYFYHTYHIQIKDDAAGGFTPSIYRAGPDTRPTLETDAIAVPLSIFDNVKTELYDALAIASRRIVNDLADGN